MGRGTVGVHVAAATASVFRSTKQGRRMRFSRGGRFGRLSTALVSQFYRKQEDNATQPEKSRKSYGSRLEGSRL